ncbi:hypothetical protein BJ170DRAFT_728483 [Xylariales sp. AK1849]|nr:hypothetical protein BJ170DRAFT_728483 [Xylariales sp. AK1849]
MADISPYLPGYLAAVEDPRHQETLDEFYKRTNIRDTVVQICGHLLCWTCSVDLEASKEEDNQRMTRACPTCRADLRFSISHGWLRDKYLEECFDEQVYSMGDRLFPQSFVRDDAKRNETDEEHDGARQSFIRRYKNSDFRDGLWTMCKQTKPSAYQPSLVEDQFALASVFSRVKNKAFDDIAPHWLDVNQIVRGLRDANNVWDEEQ